MPEDIISPKGLSYLLDKKDLKKQPEELRRICRKIFFRGKGLRSRLVSAVGSFLGLKAEEALFLSRIIEYIHNSSLLHDDFIDRSKTRRRGKAAWLEFSPAQAVLAGDYLLAKVNIYLAERENLSLLRKTAEAICRLAEGEFAQRRLMPFRSKSLKKRDRAGDLKTASLFKWCLQAPFVYKRRGEPKLFGILDRIGGLMGLLFQRSDDLMDFAVRNKDQKPYLSDLRQGHFNSFACFLLKGSSPEKEKKLSAARSVSAVYKIFPDFKAKAQAFDRLNSKIIKSAGEDLSRLKLCLRPRERELASCLKSWMNYVYWRQKPKPWPGGNI